VAHGVGRREQQGESWNVENTTAFCELDVGRPIAARPWPIIAASSWWDRMKPGD
jgi:hypothetical protein